ncbi:unnamed protein product [Lampetra planeri]
MSRKALKAVFEFHLTSVSCPGVHLTAKDDLYVSVYFLGQCRQSEHVPAVFPLRFHQKMVFEKVFRQAVDPGDVAVLLENELVQVELVQLIPPGESVLTSGRSHNVRLGPHPSFVQAQRCWPSSRKMLDASSTLNPNWFRVFLEGTESF